MGAQIRSKSTLGGVPVQRGCAKGPQGHPRVPSGSHFNDFLTYFRVFPCVYYDFRVKTNVSPCVFHDLTLCFFVVLGRVILLYFWFKFPEAV